MGDRHYRAGVRIEMAELLWLDLHLRVPHGAAHGVERHRPVVLVHLTTDVGEGWGECAALAAPTYREEYAAGAWAVLHDHLLPRVVGCTWPVEVASDAHQDATGAAVARGPAPSGAPEGAATAAVPWPSTAAGRVAAAVADGLSDVRGHPMAKAAVEMAAVDAVLTGAGRSLADVLGVTVPTVAAGAVIGLAAGTDRVREVLDAVDAAVAAGARRVRVKVVPGFDRAPLAAIRARWPSLVVQADANGAYRRDDQADLRALDELALACLEQPLHPEDLVGHADLARVLATPICLDESVRTVADVHTVAALGAADMVCVKPPCLGGIDAAVRAAAALAELGLGGFVGGMLQSALGRAVDAAMAGLLGSALPADLGQPGPALPADLGSPGPAFVEDDPFGQVPRIDGAVVVHRQPGVGPRPDAELLRKVVTRRAVCRPDGREA